MLDIKTAGIDQYLDGSGNFKLLVIGGPGAGKTRFSSFWPRPFYLDCEDGLGSVLDRQVPYVRVRSSKDMLDALEYLKSMERQPKPQRKFQTVVVDTVDSFQRIVKEEWLNDTKAGTFTGYDAWGYLDSKMGMLLTRLLNLDYNVIVLVHWKEKGSGEDKEYGLQLQGSTSDAIFNDFDLVGWLGTYWEAEEGQRVQKRGLTFQPTPDKGFLKDRFHVTPKWLPISLTDERDYQQIWDLFFNRPEFEQFAEGQVVDQIPDSEAKVVDGPVAPPQAGGPVAAQAPVELPLDKMLKPELLKKAAELGLDLAPTTLKAEIIAAIQAKQAQPAAPAAPAEPTAPTAPSEPAAPAAPAPSNSEAPAAPAEAAPSSGEAAAAASAPEPSDPTSSAPTTTADAPVASPAASSETPTSGGQAATPAQPVGEQMTTEAVAGALGATVISEQQHDTPVTQPAAPPATPAAKSAAPQGPSACADCGTDLTPEWNDTSKRDYVRLGFVKHRRYLCEGCRNKANNQ